MPLLKPSLFLLDCLELTCGCAHTALDALCLIDLECCNLNFTCDSFNRAVTCTQRALLTEIGIDYVLHQVLANAGRALLIDNVSEILVTEGLHCRENGVSSCLTESAESAGLDILCKVLKVGVELWTTEPGCGFEEHATCDSLGRVDYKTAKYSEEYTDDGEFIGEAHGFEGFGDWLSASEIYGGRE